MLLLGDKQKINILHCNCLFGTKISFSILIIEHGNTSIEELDVWAMNENF